jgi:hypothetical protein
MSRPVEHDGAVYRREGSKFWWICYRDRTGKRQRESSFIEDWQEAQKRLRARLKPGTATSCRLFVKEKA